MQFEMYFKSFISKLHTHTEPLYQSNNLHSYTQSQNIKPDLDDLENGPGEGIRTET